MNRISISQAAAQFGVSRRTLERWVRDHRLTAIPNAEDGRQRLVDPEAVQSLVQQMPKRRTKKALRTPDKSSSTDQAIDKALLQVYRQVRQLRALLDNEDAQELTLEELRAGPLGRDLQRLAALARGEVLEAKDLVLAAVDSVLQVLFWPAACEDYTVPRSFWDTDLGRMLSRAQLRAYKPTDLVSVEDVARMFGVTAPTIYRWMEDRTLGGVRDDVNARIWVVRRDVEKLKRVADEVAAQERALAS